ASGRLQLQALVQVGNDTGNSGCPHTLAASAMRLRRFDACIIPVAETNLAWARTTLSNARGVLQTPVMALVRDLKAAALNDLHGLGLSDFVRYPVCIEELRARVERLLDGRRYTATPLSAPGLAETGPYAVAG